MPAGMNSLTHRQKVDRLITDLHKQGVSSYTVAPPLFRQLWALGFHVPPPFFLGFLTLTLLTTVAAGLTAREGLRRARPVVIIVNPATPPARRPVRERQRRRHGGRRRRADGGARVRPLARVASR